MKQIWTYLSKDDIKIERQQCVEEGRDISSVQEEFDHVLALDLEDMANQPAAGNLLDRTIKLPLKPDYDFAEPSDLSAIRAARPGKRPALPPVRTSELEDRVYGAWTGRCCGCLLGKPVEGWRTPKLWGYLRDTGRWPLADYFRYDVMTAEQRATYALGPIIPCFADQVDSMPEDDDTNYTTAGLAILQQHGKEFTPGDVANFWLNNLPIGHVCTAERVAYRNFCINLFPPNSAAYQNPYREWIGAQIRADFFGYAAAGNPDLAADFAWRDASISHVKNGIYGEMWAAAMIASAFVAPDIPTIILAGLGQIPSNCRLSEAIRRVLDWRADGFEYDEVVQKLHLEWDETQSHHWCHTISNAMIVAIGLLWGNADYGKTICRAVQIGFDTDCNGATAGSVMGAFLGRRALPRQWTDRIQDTLHTGVAGYHTVKLDQITRDSLKVIEAI